VPQISFPVWIELGPWRLHPHLVFELLAYFIGFRLYLRDRKRRGDFLDDPRRWWVIAAAAAGAAGGARLLALLECPAELWSGAIPWARLAGKTVVGAIAGGWLAVEGVKRALGIESRTGDLLAIPLAVAIAIGRIGCLLTGLDDHTIGAPTALPWGIDFGDGVRRHPAPLYEILFLFCLALALARWRARAPRRGDLFRAFVAAYFAFRLLVDFWKHADCRWLGLSMIQWVTVLALSALVPDLGRWLTRRRAPGEATGN
jgi:phosphatidylglycerol:prolipoprotein diacylglycerol transferase